LSIKRKGEELFRLFQKGKEREKTTETTLPRLYAGLGGFVTS
jgi:hypothetical protein